MKVLEKIQSWYKDNCNGDWEHQYGVIIETIDNPGWQLMVDLENTNLKEAEFKSLTIERSASNWITCRVIDSKFEGFCGSQNLTEMLEVFVNWSETFEHNK